MFKFGITNLPKENLSLINELALACERFEKKLKAINFQELKITEYNKRYILQMIGSNDGLVNTLRKYAFVLAWALHKSKNFKEVIFLDYGAGHGLMGLLAAELGIKNCLLSDIYGPSMDDAKTLATSLNLNLSHTIVGDTDQTIEYLKQNNIQVDVIANYDTIEHIYEISDFFKKLPQFGENINYFFASGANGNNPFIESKLRAVHLKFERDDKEVSQGHKDRDSIEAYSTIRKRIITENFDELSDKEIDSLVKVTRGKIEKDIISISKKYIDTKVLPQEIKESTDTCDPRNGNWAEHLMDPYELNRELNTYGFKNNFVLAGFYGQPKKTINKVVGFIFNIFIKTMPTRLGLKLSPYYAIYGEKK